MHLLLVLAAGALLLLRVAELIHLNSKDVSYSGIHLWVAIRVSCSRTDPEARGPRIRWHCVCGLAHLYLVEEAPLWCQCVYHVFMFFILSVHMVDLKEVELTSRAFVPGGDAQFFPVFCHRPAG